MPRASARTRPIIGITADVDDEGCRISHAYVNAIVEAGGLPIILAPRAELASALVSQCDGILLTGGDDPIMERWGVPTHAKARRVSEIRQASELSLLEAIEDRPQLPVLGICLGMQYMALHAGATVDQHLPDTLSTHTMHAGKVWHEVDGELGCGSVLSNHRQAVVAAPGNRAMARDYVAPELRVIATAPDGVIEGVRRDDRPFYVGVQWHPERTSDSRLGRDLFAQLVASCMH